MKILAFYPYIPWPLDRGAYHRAFHLLKGLASQHSVDLLALSENGEGLAHREAFADFCEGIEFIPFQHPAWPKLFPNRLFSSLPVTVDHWRIPAAARALDAALAKGRYDAVHILDLVLAQYFIRARRDIPLVMDRTRVDLQYQLMEQRRFKPSLKNRVLNLESLAKLWFFEKAAARRCALEVVCGPDDETFVRQHISRRIPVEVIPNGVDLEYFDASTVPGGRASDPTVIFCGAMDYNPNVDALRWYFGEIHDRLANEMPGLKVLIVGKSPSAGVQAYGQKHGVTVTGPVPDVRPYYKQAWLQIVPLRIGGGTRLKIVESLAMRTPVISTCIGAQGLDLKEDHEILYAETSSDFIAQTARALKDPSLRQRLEDGGFRAVEQRLAWPQLGAKLARAYERFEKAQSAAAGGARLRPSLPPAV